MFVYSSNPVSYIVFIAFIFLIVVVLMNLLNGLAVSDTGLIRYIVAQWPCPKAIQFGFDPMFVKSSGFENNGRIQVITQKEPSKIVVKLEIE